MGLYDREYMQQDDRDKYSSGRRLMWQLIAINLLMYFFVASPGSAAYNYLALHADKWSADTLFQVVTYGFLHANFSHILSNMYGLYLFGSIVAPVLGGKKFLTLYMSGILVSSLVFYIINFGQASSLIGASGAICAVTIAAAMVDPEKKFIMIFMPFTPIKISTMVVCYTLLNFLLALADRPQDPTSYLAHLAGFAAGYLVMKLFNKDVVRWDPLKFTQKAKSTPPPHAKEKSGKKNFNSNDAGPVSNAELDALLDKVSKEGINSLSDYELSRLRRAREEMRGGK